MKSTSSKSSVEDYIKGSPKESQSTLRELRKLVKALAPEAEEVISYGMPAFKLNGKGFVAYAGYKKHVGFYPMSGTFLQTFKKELTGYKTSVGAIQFPLSEPLPVALIKKLIKMRVQENKKI